MIGSGNLATQLSLALKGANHEITQIYSPTIQHAQMLADRLGGILCTNDVKDICKDADAYVISIKDDAVHDVAMELIQGMDNPLLIHTAGSVPMAVFADVTQNAGVLYPMQTFSKARDVDFREIPCFIEATNEYAYNVISMMARSVSEHVIDANSDQRRMLHLAAVFACNMTNHCYRLAEKIVNEADLDFRLFYPLIMETARKVGEMSPHEAQTGPMVRYDVKVMEKQQSLIRDSLTKKLYQIMAESIHKDAE